MVAWFAGANPGPVSFRAWSLIVGVLVMDDAGLQGAPDSLLQKTGRDRDLIAPVMRKSPYERRWRNAVALATCGMLSRLFA
jgi:hypothetical protein